MIHQPNLFGTDLLMQLDPGDPLLKLASTIPWQEFEESLSIHYTAATGAPSKPFDGWVIDAEAVREFE